MAFFIDVAFDEIRWRLEQGYSQALAVPQASGD